MKTAPEKTIEQEAIKEARILHDVRTKNDKMTNPAYYDGAKDGYIAGRSSGLEEIVHYQNEAEFQKEEVKKLKKFIEKGLERERELEEALRTKQEIIERYENIISSLEQERMGVKGGQMFGMLNNMFPPYKLSRKAKNFKGNGEEGFLAGAQYIISKISKNDSCNSK